jgi:hypothetical protein
LLASGLTEHCTKLETTSEQGVSNDVVRTLRLPESYAMGVGVQEVF